MQTQIDRNNTRYPKVKYAFGDTTTHYVWWKIQEFRRETTKDKWERGAVREGFTCLQLKPNESVMTVMAKRGVESKKEDCFKQIVTFRSGQRRG